MIQPSIGRVVWFQPAHPADAQDRSQPWPGLVAFVHSDRCVNLGGFDLNGHPFQATSVTLLQDDDEAPKTGHYAQWMPYQVTQAKKHAAE